MKKVTDMLVPGRLPVAETADTEEAERSRPGEHSRHALLDAINRMFAEFELAYHNQFRKAWPAEGELRMAKKYWCSALEHFPPSVIIGATRQVCTSQTFLPTLSAMVMACEQALPACGLPEPHQAYREACLAPEPKATQHWSHPAVYLAGKACDWFALANQPEEQIYPLFEYHYRLLVNRVLQGEDIHAPEVQPLPASIPGQALSLEEQKQKLAALREKLAL